MGSCPSASGLSHSAWDGPEVPPGRSGCQNVLLWRPNDTHWMSGPRFSCLLIRHTCTAPPLAAVNNAVRNSSAQVFKPQLPTFGPVPGSRTAGSHGDSTLCLLSHLQASSHGSRPASHPTSRAPAPHFSTFWPTLVSWVLMTILPVGGALLSHHGSKDGCGHTRVSQITLAAGWTDAGTPGQEEAAAEPQKQATEGPLGRMVAWGDAAGF